MSTKCVFKVLKQLEEEELMQQCIEAMLDDEHEGLSNGQTGNDCNGWNSSLTTSSLTQAVDSLSINDDLAKDVMPGYCGN